MWKAEGNLHWLPRLRGTANCDCKRLPLDFEFCDIAADVFVGEVLERDTVRL